MNFILGIENLETNEIIEYQSKDEAAYNAQEWVVVEADTLEDAIGRYEETFNNWHIKEFGY